MTETTTAGDELSRVARLQDELSACEREAATVRESRDCEIRRLIRDGVTMYAIAQRIGMSQQAVRRIRDAG